MKTAFKILMILIVAGFLVWSFVGIGKDSADDRACQGIELFVEDSLSLGMIDKEEVLNIMKSKKMAFDGKKLAEINIADVERELSSSPYIDTVSCTINAGGKLIMKVVPKMPALYVMPNNGVPYFLDRRGEDMPKGELSGNLCVATGNITKDFARKRLAPIACCLQDSAFWRAQVQQIDVVNEHDIRMYTRFADHVILLGKAEKLPDQLWRLRVFYSKGLSEIGWNKYESISVAYDGVVIGKAPNNSTPTPIPAPVVQSVDSTTVNPVAAEQNAVDAKPQNGAPVEGSDAEPAPAAGSSKTKS